MRYPAGNAPPFADPYKPIAGRNILIGIQKRLCEKNGTTFALELAKRNYDDFVAVRICAALCDLVTFVD